MGDAENWTIVPLLNGYKYGLARRRFLQTATGGLRLQKAPCSIHVLQLLLYLSPAIAAAPFIALDAAAVWNEYYLSLVYSCATALVIFSLRATETCVRWRKRATVQIAASDGARVQLNDEERVDITSCCSYETLRFLVHPKGIVSLFLHSLLVTGLLSFASSFLLLPRVLSKHLPIPAAVTVGALGWLASCSAHYSLNVSPPHETATYRPTDRLELRPLTRPTHIICVATAFIPIRYTLYQARTVHASCHSRSHNCHTCPDSAGWQSTAQTSTYSCCMLACVCCRWAGCVGCCPHWTPYYPGPWSRPSPASWEAHQWPLISGICTYCTW